MKKPSRDVHRWEGDWPMITSKQLCAWLSQFTAATALVLIALFAASTRFFGNTAGMLLLAATIAAVLLILGIVSLPRWQGFVALAAFSFVAYCLLFDRMYVIACNWQTRLASSMSRIRFSHVKPRCDRRYYVCDDDVRIVLSRLPEEVYRRLRAIHFDDRSWGVRSFRIHDDTRGRDVSLCALPPDPVHNAPAEDKLL